MNSKYLTPSKNMSTCFRFNFHDFYDKEFKRLTSERPLRLIIGCDRHCWSAFISTQFPKLDFF